MVEKAAEKRLKYQDKAVEISRMWQVKTEIIPVIISLATISLELKNNLQKNLGKTNEFQIQDIAL